MNRTNRVILGIIIAVVIILLLSWANGRMAKRQAETAESTVVAASLCDEMLLMKPQDDAGSEAERPSAPAGSVEGVTLYQGAPDQRLPVERQTTGDTLNYWVWELPENPEGEYWIECSWDGGTFTRSRRLPREVRECKVGLDRDSAAAGLYAIRGVACR